MRCKYNEFLLPTFNILLNIFHFAFVENGIFNAFSFLANDQSRAMDFRIYHQHVICRKYMDISQTIFGSRGRMANMAKGPVGIWTGMASAVNIVLTAVVYIFVCLKSWAGAFGVGSITQYVSAVTALSKNISQLMEGVAELKSNVPFIRTIYEYLDIPNSMYQGSLTTEKRMDRKYEVEFKDVSFKYPGSDNWTLCHVNLKFKIGNRHSRRKWKWKDNLYKIIMPSL